MRSANSAYVTREISPGGDLFASATHFKFINEFKIEEYGERNEKFRKFRRFIYGRVGRAGRRFGVHVWCSGAVRGARCAVARQAAVGWGRTAAVPVLGERVSACSARDRGPLASLRSRWTRSPAKHTDMRPI